MANIKEEINDLISSHNPLNINKIQISLPKDVELEFKNVLNRLDNLSKPYIKLEKKKIQCFAIHSGNRCTFKSSYKLKKNDTPLCWYCCHIVLKSQNDNKEVPFLFYEENT